ncbi:MAG: LLM class flavin-dependent oxidoreductase, partial [Acidimicrobiia bacterium]|nr:LLM class flavin-dependent oxidoreductase [Acidimicrobiia bacterium]
FAYQWATLDQISQGRMVLAACTGIVSAAGASAQEGRNFGGVRDVDRPRRMIENIEICRRLWRGETLDFEGTFTSYSQLKIEPLPVQDPCPIWIAANPAPGRYWERSLRRVATVADGFQTCVMAPDSMKAMRDEVTMHLVDVGRDPATFPMMAYHNINIGPDRTDCLAESKDFLDAYYGPVFTEEMTRWWTAAGPPEACIEQLQDLIDQGATEVTLRCTSFDQAGQFDRLVNEVLPALR